MVYDITELDFPKKDGKQYATLTEAEVNLADMGEKNIVAQVRIDGSIAPDFSRDWAVVFRGEKYIMPLRKPQGAKENTSLDPVIDLTFQHWAVYQLKRWYFFTIQPDVAGTVLPDKYVSDVVLNLGDFCKLLGQILEFYYGDTIKVDLNPAWKYAEEATSVSISHSYIWNVIIEVLYKVYGVRWTIEAAGDNDNSTDGGERYVIRIGYASEELAHVFEYGFGGGLLRVERQVQSEDIRNLVLGRGGEKNLPKYYFKKSPDEEQWRSDPDWVEELAPIYFDRLRGATFRSYIQGWKAAHIDKYAGYTPAGENNAYAPWAYRKGFTDEKFDPVEYVADKILADADSSGHTARISPSYEPYIEKDSSIDRYGPMLGSREDDDEVYPTLQGTGKDIAVYIEQVTDEQDKPDADATLQTWPGAWVSVRLEAYARGEAKSQKIPFSVPAGKTANLVTGAVKPFGSSIGNVEVEDYTITIYDPQGNAHSATGLAEGSYQYELTLSLHNMTDGELFATAGTDFAKTEDASVGPESPSGVFDIWVPNIWNSEKADTETPTLYAERVWRPILGDREGDEAKVVFTTGALAIGEHEFTIVKIPQYDDSKTLSLKEGEESILSHWKITLAKSDGELDATGLYIPHTKRQGKAGDRFVFIGTEMTHIPYVTDAEIRLDDLKKDALGEWSDIKPTWTVTTDRVRLGGEGSENAIIHSLKPGCSVQLRDSRFIGGSQQETLYIQSLKITCREPSSDDAALNSDVEMTLGNDYSTGDNPVEAMQGEISAIQKQVGAISNIEQTVSAIGDKKYLRKDRSDRTLYTLAAGGLQTGQFQRGLSGSDVDATGNAEFESVVSRSFLKVYELIYNRLNALEGEYSFSDSGTIEQVTPNEDGTLTALMRRRWDGDFTAFQPGDVIYGYVNDLSNSAVKTWGKAWARVTEVDRTENTLTLVAYDDEDTPAGKNLAVTKGMTVTRWGNAIAPSEQTHALYPAFIVKRERNGEVSYVNTRQWCMVISAEQGNIRMMDGIVKPIVDPSDNITATVLGRLPKGLLDEETEALVNPDQPYLYARGIIVQDLIRIGYKGVSIRTPNFRGQWTAETAASDTDYYRMTGDMSDCAAHKGALWQCAVGHASVTEPSDSNPNWIRLTALPSEDWRIIPSTNVVYIRTDSYSTDTLEVTVRHYGDGVTDYTTPEELDATGTRLMFSLDGVKYNEYWVRQGETLADLELGDNTEGSGDTLTLGGNNVPWLEITDNIHLQLQDAQTSEVLTSYTVAVVKDGRNGADGQSVRGDFTSIVFRRSDTELSTADTPTGGTYSNPLPDGGMWTDGIPSGSERIWASSRIFKGDGTPTPWSRPRLMADTQDYDVEFSDIENPQPPQGHPNTNAQWHDPSDKSSSIDWEGMIWRAESWKRDGKWSDWTVMRIKGEKGDPGSDGTDGSSTEVRYRIVSGYPESVGIDNPHDREPQGWGTTHRLCASGESLWRTEAAILQGDTLSPAGWSVPVMVTGRPGKDGVGLDGKAGPIVYPGGVYDRDTLYISTADRCPYVMDGRQNGMGVYYRLLPEKTYCGAEHTADRDTPAKDYALSDSQTVWQRMDGFRSLFAEVLMARFARLGDAVFYDNWMFSAMGTDSQGNESSEYGDFGNASSPFIPNLQIDLLNGDIIARRGDFYGWVRQRPTVITPENVDRYSNAYNLIDWRKTGTCIRFEGTFGGGEIISLPYMSQSEMTAADLAEARTYIGSTVSVYNASNMGVQVAGRFITGQEAKPGQRPGADGTVAVYNVIEETSLSVPAGGMRTFRCVSEGNDGTEDIAWIATESLVMRTS